MNVIAEKDIIQGFSLLAEKIPVNTNPWTPYAIINFACCSFTGEYDYLLNRVEKITQLNGLLQEIQEKSLDNGYEQNIKCSFGALGFDFGITFRNKVGGFIIGYNPRKYWQTLNHDLIAALFKYHAAQENYGSDLKKK